MNGLGFSALFFGAIMACLYYLPLTDTRRVEVPAGDAATAGIEVAPIEPRASGHVFESVPAVLPAIDDPVSPAQRSGRDSAVSSAAVQSIDWLEFLYPDLVRISELEKDPAGTALVELAPMLAGEDPVIRLAAIEAVGDMSIAAVVPVLSMALHDPDPQVRVSALQALGERDDESVGVNIESCLYDPDPEVRLAAIDALAAIEARSAVYALASLLSDPEVSIRRRAVDALGDIGGESAIRYLQQARHDTDETIRLNADAILAELN